MFSEISQNSHEHTCARGSFLKKSLWHRCFPMNFAKLSKTPFYRTPPVAASVKLYCLDRFSSISLFKIESPIIKQVPGG